MPGEKQNEIKRKLENLSEVPRDFRFRSDAVWRKMEGGLGGRKKNRTILWIALAACFMGAAFIYFVYPSAKKETPFVVSSEAGKSNVPAHNQPVSKNNSQQAIKREAPGSHEVKLQASEHKIPSGDIQKNIVSPFIDTPALAAIHSSLPAPDTSTAKSANTVAAAAKPRFRIAHINELNAAQQTLPEMPKQKDGLALRKLIRRSLASEESGTEELSPDTKKPRYFFSLISSSQ
jgi:hypothetical protein